jgi:hypothetical protein
MASIFCITYFLESKEFFMKKYLIANLFFLFLHIVFAQTPYLGQKLPDIIPVEFPLQVTPGYFAAEKIAISSNNKEFYYSELDGYFNHSRIKCISWKNDSWTNPVIVFENYYSPSLSIDGTKMFFQSIEHQNEVWFSERESSGWTSPSRYWPNMHLNYNLQETNSGYYYVSSSESKDGLGDWDWSKIKNDGTEFIPQSLGKPLNNAGKQIDSFIAKDESYIIIARSGVLMISFHNSNGSWTDPQGLSLNGWAPYISDDNAYLFFTNGGDPSNVKIFWLNWTNMLYNIKIAK